MTDSHECPDHPPLEPSEMQYSLRTAFIVTTGFALTFSGVFAGPDWVSMVTLIAFTTLITIALTIVLIYGRTYQRTFCIGSLIPSGLVTLQSLGGLAASISYGMGMGMGMGGEMNSLQVAICLIVYCLIVIVAGTFAVGVRWMVESFHPS